MQFTEYFDIVVVGAGHAGCEVEAFARPIRQLRPAELLRAGYKPSRALKSRTLSAKRSAGGRGGT